MPGRALVESQSGCNCMNEVLVDNAKSIDLETC